MSARFGSINATTETRKFGLQSIAYFESSQAVTSIFSRVASKLHGCIAGSLSLFTVFYAMLFYFLTEIAEIQRKQSAGNTKTF